MQREHKAPTESRLSDQMRSFCGGWSNAATWATAGRMGLNGIKLKEENVNLHPRWRHT
jgi:hypothetical protein